MCLRGRIGGSSNSGDLVVVLASLVYTSPMSHRDPHPQSGRMVHEFLAHSYLLYLAAVVIGFGADLLWPIKFSFPYDMELGFFFILSGTVLAVWAQYASGRSSHLRNVAPEDIQHRHFNFGPYTYTRTPTQYGLVLMVIGLSLLYGFTFMLATAIVAFILGKFFFIKKQEEHLARKYGAPYLEYKKHVKF